MNQTVKTNWDLAPAPESVSHVSIEDSYGLFINGKFVESEGGDSFASINPATEQPLAQISEATEADVDKAVKAARQAYTCLLYTSPSPRDQRGSRMPSSA